MSYDLEKYREKREKVLGVRKRGISFGAMAAIVSVSILFGLGAVVIPKSVAYLNNRHLDDAIYKLTRATDSPANVEGLASLDGIRSVVVDDKKMRLLVTFDKSITDTDKIGAFLRSRDASIVLLNRISHHDRMTTLRKESEFDALLPKDQ